MFSCGERAPPGSPGPASGARSGGGSSAGGSTRRKRGRTEPASTLAKKSRFQPSVEARQTLPPDLLKKAEGWLREAVHILNLAQCVSTDPSVKAGLFTYASELLVSAIKLDTDGHDVPRVLVDVTKDLAAERLRLHAEGVMHLASAPGTKVQAAHDRLREGAVPGRAAKGALGYRGARGLGDC
jgi:hypothetical protein